MNESQSVKPCKMNRRVYIKSIFKNPQLRQELIDGSTDFICTVEHIRK